MIPSGMKIASIFRRLFPSLEIKWAKSSNFRGLTPTAKWPVLFKRPARYMRAFFRPKEAPPSWSGIRLRGHRASSQAKLASPKQIPVQSFIVGKRGTRPAHPAQRCREPMHHPKASSRARTLWSKCAARLLDRAGISFIPSAFPPKHTRNTSAHRGVCVAAVEFSTSIHRFVVRVTDVAAVRS